MILFGPRIPWYNARVLKTGLETSPQAVFINNFTLLKTKFKFKNYRNCQKNMT